MAEVVFEKASCVYPGATQPAVDELDLRIDDGELLVLVGPSGCGKSTSLRLLAGLEPLTSGTIRIGDRNVTGLPPQQRDIAMVFQNYALYPHMSVAENMGFALRIAGVSRDERGRRVRDAAKLLDLEPYLERRPRDLSGGQRQRVAMGRAIVRQPKVFCMDEPLSNLDAKLRVSTRTQIAELQQRLGVTTAYVTHDQVEAMTLGDRVAVMKDGVLLQCDRPLRLFERPANVFVAEFIGSPAMNLLTLPVADGTASFGSAPIELSSDGRSALAAEGAARAVVGLRPEAVRLVSDESGLRIRVDLVEELGADAFAYGTVEGSGPIGVDGERVVVRVDPRSHPIRGDRVSVAPTGEDVHLFSVATGDRLAG